MMDSQQGESTTTLGFIDVKVLIKSKIFGFSNLQQERLLSLELPSPFDKETNILFSNILHTNKYG